MSPVSCSDILSDLKSVISKLRYVKRGDEFRSEDYNNVARAISDVEKFIESCAGLDPSYGDLIQSLKTIVSSMKVMSPGDLIASAEYNKLVSSLYLVEQLLEAITPTVPLSTLDELDINIYTTMNYAAPTSIGLSDRYDLKSSANAYVVPILSTSLSDSYSVSADAKSYTVPILSTGLSDSYTLRVTASASLST